jgi:hypothetical protein
MSLVTVFAHFTAGSPIYHDCIETVEGTAGVFKRYFPLMLTRKQSYDLALRIEMYQEGLDHANDSADDLEMTWVVKYRAINVLFTQSRFFQIILGVLKFTICVAIISMDATIWIYISAAVLFPYALISAIPGFIFLATVFKLRDEDFRVLYTGSFERPDGFRKSSFNHINGTFRKSQEFRKSLQNSFHENEVKNPHFSDAESAGDMNNMRSSVELSPVPSRNQSVDDSESSLPIPIVQGRALSYRRDISDEDIVQSRTESSLPIAFGKSMTDENSS